MLNIGLPLFDLKSTNDYLFIAGGGGSKEYGKENGVMAIQKTSLVRSAQKVKCFYKTTDFIVFLQVYTERLTEASTLLPVIPIEEAPSIADGYASSESEFTIPYGKDFSSSEEVIIQPEKSGEVSPPVKTEKKFPERKPSNAIFVLALGDENLYILKFTNSFTLHCKLERSAQFAFLNRHLFVLKNEKIQAFYDTIKNPSSVHFKIRKIEENVSDPTEEYVYKLYKGRSEIIPLNEHFTRDIPKDWNGFFIFGNKIHKILKRGQMNVFAFKNQKYEVPGKISRVVVQKETLIFYSNTEKEGSLYFIGQEDKVYKLPRITALDTWNNTAIVATLNGNAILYRDGLYLQRTGSFKEPVTGITLDNYKIYYTLLSGEIGWMRRVSTFERVFKYTSLAIVVIAAIVYFVMKMK